MVSEKLRRLRLELADAAVPLGKVVLSCLTLINSTPVFGWMAAHPTGISQEGRGEREGLPSQAPLTL